MDPQKKFSIFELIVMLVIGFLIVLFVRESLLQIYDILKKPMPCGLSNGCQGLIPGQKYICNLSGDRAFPRGEYICACNSDCTINFSLRKEK